MCVCVCLVALVMHVLSACVCIWACMSVFVAAVHEQLTVKCHSNSYNLVIYSSPTLHVEPDLRPFEQDDCNTGSEWDCKESGIACWQSDTRGRCQAIHRSPPVGPQQQHCADWFDIESANILLGLGSERWVDYWRECVTSCNPCWPHLVIQRNLRPDKLLQQPTAAFKI